MPDLYSIFSVLNIIFCSAACKRVAVNRRIDEMRVRQTAVFFMRLFPPLSSVVERSGR